MSIVDDLKSIVSPRKRGNGPLEVARKGTPIVSPGGTSSQTGGGAGMDWPLTENDATTRTTWDPYVVETSDGLLTWEVEPYKAFDLTDGAGGSGQLVLADPYAADR